MRKGMVLAAVLLAFGLSACGQAITPVDGIGSGSTDDHGAAASTGVVGPLDHAHKPSVIDHFIVHDPVGYCGNMITKLESKTGERWEKSFAGGESVAVTDMVSFLDYQDKLCRCAVEYTVTTEEGLGYDVNLTEGFVRHDGKQVQLTQEQKDELSEIFEKVKTAEEGALLN